MSLVLELSLRFGVTRRAWSWVDMEGMDGKRLSSNSRVGYANYAESPVGEYPFVMMLDFRGGGVFMKNWNLQLSILRMMHSYCLHGSSAR